jgi:two-component system chemotaxis response regulator CheY
MSLYSLYRDEDDALNRPRRSAQPHAAIGDSGAHVSQRLSRILVVDDDEGIRELLRLHLANAGYDVVMAEDAAVAIRAILDRVPDLIIADVNMPYLSGFELVEALKGDRTVPEIPVMFLTASSDAGERATELGAVKCLFKPLRADVLLSAVERALKLTEELVPDQAAM